MDKKDLIKLFMRAIRKEVAPTVRSVVKEILSEEITKMKNEILESLGSNNHVIHEDVNSISNIPDLGLIDDDSHVRQEEPIRKRKLFSEDKVPGTLADLLNDTANQNGGISRNNAKPGNQQTVVVNDRANTLDKAEIAKKLGYGDLSGMMNETGINPGYQQTVEVPATTPDGRPVNTNKIPDFLLGALSKDYSAVLKKSEEKSKFRRGQ